MPEQSQQPSGILRVSPSTFQKMVERGEAVVHPKKEPISVEVALNEFKTSTHTPDLYTYVFQTIWIKRGKKLQEQNKIIDTSVPPCSYTQKEINSLEKEDRRLAYSPKDLSTQANRHLLRTLFPDMSRSVDEENTVTNDVNRFGWFDYDGALDAPYLNTTEDQLKEEAIK